MVAYAYVHSTIPANLRYIGWKLVVTDMVGDVHQDCCHEVLKFEGWIRGHLACVDEFLSRCHGICVLHGLLH